MKFNGVSMYTLFVAKLSFWLSITLLGCVATPNAYQFVNADFGPYPENYTRIAGEYAQRPVEGYVIHDDDITYGWKGALFVPGLPIRDYLIRDGKLVGVFDRKKPYKKPLYYITDYRTGRRTGAVYGK